ncbi:hypothetical protein ADIAG_02802 [Paeniglutamicibacter gangotriensis Lz1y]|uniref:Uncharacterized protein n=1 Tax=Paeniglutamicibacter gangotriensis Lz1y TaxID=1276920 RepID=M7N7V3_9MICC|nr:hypothetical protein ADIAG_02802 [Paeniglutamicibacter gangotriensis Lz1y]
MMQGMQGHGSTVNGRGAELRKTPVSINLSDLGCLAENTQDGILFGSAREEFTYALFGYPAASKVFVDSEFLDNNGSRRRDCHT